MEVIKCNQCSADLPLRGFFCPSCGTQVKCKNCNDLLEPMAKACVSCGTLVYGSPPETAALNTIEFNETKESRSFKASFTDKVGTNISESINTILTSKMRSLPPASNNPVSAQGKEKTIDVSYSIPNAEPYLDSGNANSDLKDIESIQATNSYPSLIAISMKNLPASEAEWLVVYSFYASNYGTDIFTRKDLILKYEESKRKTTERVKGLSAYIKQAVKSGYINPLGDTFSMLDAGIIHAKEIINRTSSSAPKTSRGKKDAKEVVPSNNDEVKKTSSQARPLKRLANIDFEPKGKEALRDFVNRFSPESDLARNLLFVFYMEDILEIKGITIDHIYTCYDALDLRVSENLPQTVRNTKSKKGWIETEDTSNITVTIKGRNQIKAWNKKS